MVITGMLVPIISESLPGYDSNYVLKVIAHNDGGWSGRDSWVTDIGTGY